VLKSFAAPFRQYFNSRFSAIHDSVVHEHALLEGLIDATGRVDEDLQHSLSIVGRSIEQLGAKIDGLAGGTAGQPGAQDPDVPTMAEVAFFYRQLSDVPAGGRVLVVGPTEAAAGACLDALGYEVTAALEAVVPSPGSEPFDAVVVVSGPAHGGGGIPDDDEAATAAVEHLRTVSRPGTRLVLAARRSVVASQEDKRLATLLHDWDVVDRRYLARHGSGQWRAVPSASDLEGEHVLLLSADRSAEG
jgi:hypothetical protein